MGEIISAQRIKIMRFWTILRYFSKLWLLKFNIFHCYSIFVNSFPFHSKARNWGESLQVISFNSYFQIEQSSSCLSTCAISTIKRNKMTGHQSLIPWIDSQLIHTETPHNLIVNWKPSVLSPKLVMKREKTAHTCDLTAFASTVSRLNAFDIFKHDKTPVEVFSIFSLGPFSRFYFKLQIAISSQLFRSYKWAKLSKLFYHRNKSSS